MYSLWKQDHATKTGFSHVVSILKLVANRGDPTRLTYKINHQVETREQWYNPNPFYLSNPPTNPCPNVSKGSKDKHPITQ